MCEASSGSSACPRARTTTAAYSPSSPTSRRASRREQRANRVRRQLRLREEAGSGGPLDRVGQVALRAGRDQDHSGSVTAVCDKPPRELEPVILTERHVDEHEIGPQRLGLPKRARTRRGDPHDRQTLALEQPTGTVEKDSIVVDDQAAKGHRPSVAESSPGRIGASTDPRTWASKEPSSRLASMPPIPLAAIVPPIAPPQPGGDDAGNPGHRRPRERRKRN